MVPILYVPAHAASNAFIMISDRRCIVSIGKDHGNDIDPAMERIDCPFHLMASERVLRRSVGREQYFTSPVIPMSCCACSLSFAFVHSLTQLAVLFVSSFERIGRFRYLLMYLLLPCPQGYRLISLAPGTFLEIVRFCFAVKLEKLESCRSEVCRVRGFLGGGRDRTHCKDGIELIAMSGSNSLRKEGD